MANFGEVIQNVGGGAGSVISMAIWVLVIAVGLLVVVGPIGYSMWNKRRWNLDVEIKLPRANATITIGEWGKGYFDVKRGCIIFKRPGNRTKYSVKVFDLKEYLQGDRLITLIQVGPEDFRPVRAVSWTEYLVTKRTNIPKLNPDGTQVVDSEGNPVYEKEFTKDSILNIKTDDGKNKAWKSSFEASAKNAFTIRNWLMQHQMAVSIGIVFLACFIGFAILWTKLSSVCAG